MNAQQSPRKSKGKGKEKEAVRPLGEPATAKAQAAQAQTPPATQQTPQTQHNESRAPTAPSMVEPPVAPASGPTPRVVAAANDATPRGEKRAHEKGSAAEGRPRKAPKRTATRSNAAVQAQVEDEGQAGPSQPKQTKPRKTPVKKPRESAKDARAQATSEENAGTGEQSDGTAVAPSKTKKTPARRGRPPKAKTPARVVENEDAAAAQDAQGEGAAAGETALTPARKPKKPRKTQQKKAPKAPVASNGQADGEPATTEVANEEGGEQAQESDPELHEIDPNSLSMYSLSRQKRYGKTSNREKQMAEIDWDEVKRKRNEEIERIAQGVEQPTQRPSKRQPSAAADGDEEMLDGDEDGDGEDAHQAAETRPVGGGPTFRMVNGQLALDEDSTQIDRDAQARARIDEDTGEVEEDNDLTRFYNRTTHMLDRKRDVTERLPFWKAKSDPWNEEETDRFYDALRNWGTDFMIISQLFPGKTRMQVKKKYTREEKLDPERITAALLGNVTATATITSDRLDAFAQASNVPVEDLNKFESLEHANEIIAESMKDKEEAMRAAVAEEEEVERQRQVQLAQRKSAAEKRELKKLETQRKRMLKKKGILGGGGFGGAADGGEGEVVAGAGVGDGEGGD